MKMIEAGVLSLMIGLSSMTPTNAAVFTVGSDPAACNFTNLQSAIAHAALVPGEDELHLSGDFSMVAAVISDGESLEVIGGHDTCLSAMATGQSVLTGTNASPVLQVRGSQRVGLHNLVFQRGFSSFNGGYGGGLQVSLPTKRLILNNIVARKNNASFGGGISIRGSQNQSIVVLGNRIVLESNTASRDGGGLYQFYALSSIDDLNVSFNTAQRNGGGLMIAEGAVLHSAVLNSGNGLFWNQARNSGGGVAIERGAQFVFYHGETSAPAGQISFNEAQFGGGAHVMNNRPVGNTALATYGVNFDSNLASIEGGAVAIRTSGTSAQPIYASAAINDLVGADLRPCANKLKCDVLSGNRSANFSGQKNGAVIAISNSGAGVGYAVFRGTTIYNNDGLDLFNIIADTGSAGNHGYLVIEDSLIDNNTTSQHLISSTGDEHVLVKQSTFAANFTSGATLNTPHQVLLVDNIFNDSAPVLDSVPVNFHLENLLVKNPVGLPYVLNLIVDDAQFEDEATRNFQLRLRSAAIDQAPAYAINAQDRAGENRTVRLFSDLSPRDLGCFERQQF